MATTLERPAGLAIAYNSVSSAGPLSRALVLPAAVLLVGIALIHFRVGGRHLAEYAPFGYLSFGAAALEVLLALVLLCRSTRRDVDLSDLLTTAMQLSPAAPLPSIATVSGTVTYCTPNGVALAMDLFQPSPRGPAARACRALR